MKSRMWRDAIWLKRGIVKRKKTDHNKNIISASCTKAPALNFYSPEKQGYRIQQMHIASCHRLFPELYLFLVAKIMKIFISLIYPLGLHIEKRECKLTGWNCSKFDTIMNTKQVIHMYTKIEAEKKCTHTSI